MELQDYRKDYLENVKMIAAADNEGTVSTFVENTLESLQEINVVGDYELCYATGKNGRKNFRIDAYSFDDYDCTMSLVVADYSGEDKISTITLTEALILFDKVNMFLDGAIYGNFRYEFEISTPACDLVERLLHLKNTIRKYKFFILTDKEISGKITAIETGETSGIPIEYNIWDISRLSRVLNTGDGHEPVEINFLSITKEGLPCLEASDVSTDEFKCLLSVIPGNILADLYDSYGSSLLEGNVRSFLSTKVAANKNIRKTIIGADGENKHMFFSYNNGISATATSVTLEENSKGKYITMINNLQIVNGGQTTASLSNTRFKDKADLAGIFVQMKLTVIPNHDLAQILIPKISKGSNSQSKVSDADFFSNHEFNIRMEQVSRRIYAPAVNGQQYETHWFFERSRGQYAQEQIKMSKSEQKKYQMQNPKEQKITKTDIAKYRNAWRYYPYFVSMGAQKNFARYADYIVEEWDKDDRGFNELYYRNTVVLALIFKFIDKIVPKQHWYDKGYKANIVVYTMSYFHFLIKQKYPNHEIDMKNIWEKQKLPECIENELIKMSKFIFEHITDSSRAITNVTEWCKKEQCWILLKVKEYDLNSEIVQVLIDKNQLKKETSEGKKEHALVNGIEVQAEVVQKGQEYWEKALVWGKDKKILSDIDISFLSSATKMNYGRIPSEKQCQRIINIQAKLIDEGFSVD